MDDTHFSELVESAKEGAGLLKKKPMTFDDFMRKFWFVIWVVFAILDFILIFIIAQHRYCLCS